MELTERQDSLSRFLESSDDGSYYMGHASVLVRLSGRKFLIDPVLPRPLFLDSWLFFPPLSLDPRLLDVDGVFISHCHEDHFDLEFLRKLNPGTPIYITKGRVGLESLQASGTPYNVVQLEPDVLNQLGGGIEALPLESDHNNFDSSFLIRNSDFALYQGNDNFINEETIQKAFRLGGTVDHAYIPYAYVWWYPFCLTSISNELRNAEAERLNERNMGIGNRIAKGLNARMVIPSAGNLVFYDSADSVINRGIATPFDYLEFIQKTEGIEAASRVHTLFAGDFALKTKNGDFLSCSQFGKKQYFSQLNEFLEKWKSRQAPEPTRLRMSDDDLKMLRKRIVEAPKPNFEWSIAFVRADRPEFSINLNLKSGKLTLEKEPLAPTRKMIFRIQAHAFESWITGMISFETILNSQRFTLERTPEVFEPETWAFLRQYL